jgi:hypothetical protein
MLRDLTNRIYYWRKKPQIVYMNAADTCMIQSTGVAPYGQTAQSVPTAQSVLFASIRTNSKTDMMNTDTETIEAESVIGGSAEAQAVATGVDKKPQTGRKSRVRKTNTTPRVAIAKKTKAPKVARNPFRRSETGKLKLKSLQMGKRVETMLPRVAVMRDRLETMESRLEFVSGKLKLVKEELSSREGATVSSETIDDDMQVAEAMALENELEQLPE